MAMQMPPGAMPQGARQINPEQLVIGLAPLVAEATKIFDAGATMQSVLRESVLAAYLVGRGLTPTQAMETVLQWRMSRVAPSLARQMRAEAPGGGTAVAGGQTAGAVPGGLTERERNDLVPQIQKFMQDQADAVAFYGELIEQLQAEELKDYVRHAREDEQKHYRMLGELYQALTGRTYEVQPRPTEFASLAAGLKLAMDDEYAAAEEYRDVYLKYNDRRVRNLFFELMTDELEHATRFNYVLQAL